MIVLIAKNGSACEDCYKWTSYKTNRFEINHPSSWVLNEEGDGGTTFILLSEHEDKQDSFRENIFLIVQDFSKYDLSLEQYVQSSTNQFSKLIHQYKIISNTKSESDGKEFQKIVYTGKQGNLNLQYTQCFWVYKKNVYVLTYICEIPKIDKFKFMTDKILESFYLKG